MKSMLCNKALPFALGMGGELNFYFNSSFKFKEKTSAPPAGAPRVKNDECVALLAIERNREHSTERCSGSVADLAI